MKITWKGMLPLLAVFLMFFSGCDKDSNNNDSGQSSQPARDFGSEVPTAWFKLAYSEAKTAGMSPPLASRFFAYSGVSLYEAVVPGMSGYHTLAGQLHELTPLPQPTDGLEYDWPTVANSALATIFKHMLATLPNANLNKVDSLENAFNTEFEPQLTQTVFRRSVLQGQAIGVSIFEWSQTDGYEIYHNCAYTPPTGPGLWVPTPPAFAPALEPCWGQMRPFAMLMSDECDLTNPPQYSEAPTSQFYTEAAEVYSTVRDLSPSQLDIALFWADNPGQTGTPPGHSINITTEILTSKHSSLAVAAEAYAKVGMATADAFIACWKTKFEINLLRPVTYIQNIIDPNWNPVLNTPPFPECPSGHSVQSGAVAKVLTDIFGDMPFTDSTNFDAGLAPRSFSSFNDAAQETAISRLYAGIHFRTAIMRGLDQGACVGDQINALEFRSVQ